MKQIFNILILTLLVAFSSCTRTHFIDGPDPIAHHDKTMWEYFESQPYDWSMTMQLIDHAGLRDLFIGKSQYGTDITFFGITNFSIMRYLYDKEKRHYEDTGEKITLEVKDLPREDCKRWILNCVYPKKRMLEEWPAGRPSSDPSKLIGTGGKVYQMASGLKLWIYTFKEPYDGVPEMGPLKINLVSLDETRQKRTRVASHNIDTNTGVVQALDYNFTLNDF